LGEKGTHAIIRTFLSIYYFLHLPKYLLFDGRKGGC
jgi:hypothetical protein